MCYTCEDPECPGSCQKPARRKRDPRTYRVVAVSRGLFVIQRNDGKFAGCFGWNIDWVNDADLAFHYDRKTDAADAMQRIARYVGREAVT